LYPSLLGSISLRVPVGYIRDISTFTVDSSCKNCSSGCCPSVSSVVWMGVDIFNTNKCFT
jgi:hypothetical protein